MKFRLIVILVFCCLITSSSFSQNNEVELRNKIGTAEDTTTLVNAFLNLAKYYYQTSGKGDSLLLYSNKALVLSRSLDSEKQTLEALKYSGVGYLMNKEFDNAETNFKSGLSIARKNSDLKNQANLHNKLGTLYQNKGQVILAVENLIEASKYSKKIKDYKNVAQAYYGISFIYANQDQFDKQLEYIKKALNVIENNNINDPLMENIILGFASQQYLELYQNQRGTNYLDDVFKFANEALEIAKRHNFKSREISSYNVLSGYYFAKKDFRNSEFYTKKVLKNRHLVNENIIINAFYNLAIGHKERQQKSLVYAYLDTLNALKIKSDPYYGSGISNFTYQNYKYFNDSDLALKALEENLVFDKELYDKEKSKSINELETKYKTELKDAEINNLNQKHQINGLELKNKQTQINKLIVFFVIATLILISILFITKMIQLKRNRQKNHELKLAFDKQIELEKELADVRDEIAQDFHDELGNKLARISLLSNLISGEVSINDPKVKSKLNQITEDANGLYRGTRDFVFSLKSNSDYLEEIVTYLSDFGSEYFSKTNIKFIVKKDISINYKLPYYWNRQLVYMFKEALTNALKHSKGSTVILDFHYKEDRLKIDCIDDGIGISENNLNSSNGISNMKHRAKKLNGELLVKSKKGKGTTISFIGKTKS